MDKELNIRAVWQAGKLVQESFLNYFPAVQPLLLSALQTVSSIGLR